MPPPPDHTWDAEPSGPAGSTPPGEPSPAGDTLPLPEGVIEDVPASAPKPVADDARYTRDGLLGRGGMGVVYLARDRRLDRVVALKEAARGGEVAARLAREAKVTAGLDHPGIVTVHDSGITAEGRPFYTMRLLRGRALSLALAERTTLDARLGLLRHYLDVCNAVAYAHAEGVVHRDLKPANIMVGAFGETQVVDWGLATRLGTPDPVGAEPIPRADTDTRTGAVLGTPAYMSPEQARGEPAGPASDVWSLGAILFEILSGRTPRARGSSDEVLALARTGATPSLTDVDAPPELVTVTRRALARDPADRYPNAGALATDIAAYLDGQLVAAHRYTPWELLTRLVRAWRAPLLVGAGALLVVVTLIAASTWRLKQERDLVAAAELQTRGALATSDESLSRALVAEARTALRDGSTATAAVLASRAIVLGGQPEAWGVLAGTAVEARAERLAVTPLPPCRSYVALGEDDFVCVQESGVSRIRAGATLWTHPGPVDWVRADPNQLFLGATGGHTVELDPLTGAARPAAWIAFGPFGARSWPVQLAQWGLDPADPLAFSVLVKRLCPRAPYTNAGQRLAQGTYVALCDDGGIGIGTIGHAPDRTFTTPFTYEAFAGVTSVLPSPDGAFLVLAGTKGDLGVVDLRTGATVREVAADREAMWPADISADSARVAIAGDSGDVEVRELPGLALIARVPARHLHDARFLPDGTLLVANDATLSRWRLPAQPSPSVLRNRSGVTSATFSPDGRHLATAHGRLDALVWELPTGRRRARLDIGANTAKAAAFSPDGSTVWFAVTSGEAAGQRPLPLRVDAGPVESPSDRFIDDLVVAAGIPPTGAVTTRRIAVLRTGLVVAPSYVVGLMFTLDPPTHTSPPLDDCPPQEWIDLAQSSDGAYAVLVGEHGAIHILDPGPPARCRPLLTVEGASAADIDTSGTALVVAAGESLVRLTAEGREVWRVPHPERILDVAISADGRWVATAGADHDARLFEGATGALRAVLPGHTERVASVDFRADGRVLVTGSWDGSARLWGLDILDAAVAGLDARTQAGWGITLEDALEATGE